MIQIKCIGSLSFCVAKEIKSSTLSVKMLRKSNYDYWANALLQEAEKLKPKGLIEGVIMKYGIHN